MAYQLYDISSPTRITPAGTHSGVDITIQNVSTSNIFVGTNNSVNISNYGYKLEAGKSVAFSVASQDVLWINSEPAINAQVAVLTLGLTTK